jgi:hypothetical protein
LLLLVLLLLLLLLLCFGICQGAAALRLLCI